MLVLRLGFRLEVGNNNYFTVKERVGVLHVIVMVKVWGKHPRAQCESVTSQAQYRSTSTSSIICLTRSRHNCVGPCEMRNRE